MFVRKDTIPGIELQEFLNHQPLHTAVSLLVGSPKESLHICRDSILVYSCTKSPEILRQSIDVLCELIGPKTKMKIDGLESLPTDLLPLVPLIAKWSEGDDGWREDKLRKSSKSSLQQLIKYVEPHLVAINNYLDSHDDEMAHALGRLAECAMEARLQVGKN